jgi:hypothetical protein
MTSRLLLALLATGALSGGEALRPADAQKAAGTAAEIEIPKWRVDLVTGNGDDWWITSKLKNMKTALWGDGLPDVTASPAQDRQRCPALKLPTSFYGAARYSSWRRLYGEWNTGNDVTVATFEQNYLNIGFSRDVKTVQVTIYTAATGQVAARTRPFSDEQLLTSFNWKSPVLNNSYAVANGTNVTNGTWANNDTYADWNLAIFDCVGTLMYVVKQKNLHPLPNEILLYSRDGKLISSSQTGHPVLRYQFVDPSSGYLIATAEAPGINASITRKDIPVNDELGNVLPFGFKFEEGGYANSSALMENEYRWVLATAVQALAIYKAEERLSSWTLIAVVEAFLIACIVVSVLMVGGLFFCIYSLVFPGGRHDFSHCHGRLGENKFLAQFHSDLLVDPKAARRTTAMKSGWQTYGSNLTRF